MIRSYSKSVERYCNGICTLGKCLSLEKQLSIGLICEQTLPIDFAAASQHSFEKLTGIEPHQQESFDISMLGRVL